MPSPARTWLAALVAVVTLAGCTSAAAPTTPLDGIRISPVAGIAVDRPSLPAVPLKVDGLLAGLTGGGLAPYLGQVVTWFACGADKCTNVVVPLDYANPGRAAVTVALRMKPATASPKLGPLFVNPGGPGGSGQALVDYFDNQGLEQYDIVGWDPRGTGGSTPVRCLTDEQADAFLALDASPDNEAEREALIRGNYDFGKGCWERNGDYLNHIGTVDTVRDLDLLRQLLGAPKLNYLGYSYGTDIGAVYAELFGGNTGHLVLDAAVNITDDDSIIQAQGFDLALGNFASWCAKQDCGLGDSKEAVLSSITDFLDGLDAKPIAVGERQLTQSLAATGIADALYSGKDAWEPLSAIIQRAQKGEGGYLLAAADSLNGRDSKGHYGSLFFSFPAISCLDGKDEGVLDADRQWTEDAAKAPIFGKYFGPVYNCALWPTRPSQRLQLHPTGASARPLLVIGATGDPATPYPFAQSMARQLKSATLVTYDGEGHGGYGGKSRCLDSIVVKYLTKGIVPTGDVRCT
ncbi:MAG: alpha/beta fold hydrolase [Propionibacteriaceae bacterium]|nr:alpha/beta fold hydrolase [Propionibacteriaceae bacterium]